METLGLMPWGSNYTFLMQITNPQTKDLPEDDREDLLAVYKPRRGESPLWDFPNGTLCLREYAAGLVADALGWRIVPPTVLRDGENGFGSVQLFIENDPDQHYFTFKDDPDCRDQLQRICVFDLITNNADRKSGHCLRDMSGHVWAIDHGICFNADYKLRTVIWDFASAADLRARCWPTCASCARGSGRQTDRSAKPCASCLIAGNARLRKTRGWLAQDQGLPQPQPLRAQHAVAACLSPWSHDLRRAARKANQCWRHPVVGGIDAGGAARRGVCACRKSPARSRAACATQIGTPLPPLVLSDIGGWRGTERVTVLLLGIDQRPKRRPGSHAHGHDDLADHRPACQRPPAC